MWCAGVQSEMGVLLEGVKPQGGWTYDVPADPQVSRDQWVLQWPGQVVICVSSIFWTQEVSAALEERTLPVRQLCEPIGGSPGV